MSNLTFSKTKYEVELPAYWTKASNIKNLKENAEIMLGLVASACFRTQQVETGVFQVQDRMDYIDSLYHKSKQKKAINVS